jgi:deoxyribodipyrimidine photolyase-related protein
MKTLRFILGDQLSHFISSLNNCDPTQDIVMLCEVIEEASYVPHHKLKIAFLFSAMRHFALELGKKDFNVHYVKLTDKDNTQSFDTELARAVKKFHPDKIVVTEPGEYRVLQKLLQWQQDFSIPVEILDDHRFFCSNAEFKLFAADKKQLRMENFYHKMRLQHNILLNPDKTPIGGKWNFDSDNRKSFKKNLFFPKRLSFKKDAITDEVIALVAKRFPNHFGNLDDFYFAIDRPQALKLLRHFIKSILPNFGDYQDMMMQDQAFLYHSVLSPYINAGLLTPAEVCQQAEAAYFAQEAPLNAVEGFIRQILGWREFIRGIYWLKMPGYAEENYFQATKTLPDFYWNANTEMNCLKQVVQQTMNNAYSHHIQRLMITGNFALLAGLTPKEVCDWYLLVYADAYEWVELPNTLGMALFGDGGFVASKPYIASANYINKMSNYCKRCAYNPKQTLEDTACPFNSLYWNFLAEHETLLKHNPRLHYMYVMWNKKSLTQKDAIKVKAKKVLSCM